MGTFILIFAGVGLLLVILAIPLIRRRISPNGWYGVRVAATYADAWVWYEANAQSGRDLMILGVLQTAAALFVPLLGIASTSIYVDINIALLVAGALTFAILGIRRANRLLRERQGKPA